ncbi:MAG: hypothetical protein ACPGEG_06955 [Salibacteraceae bacterium]
MSKQVKKIAEKIAMGLFMVLTISFFTTGCDELSPPKAEITVTDSTGIAVEDARVILYCVQRPEESRECVVVDTQMTDQVGKAYFEFENPSVLKIDVWKADVREVITGTFPNEVITLVGDTVCTEGFITLENDEVIEQRLIVDVCNSEL